MRQNAKKVLEAFAQGKPCNGKTISTDGQNLYSYRMLIATNRPISTDNTITLIDYEKAPTATTRSHVRAAERLFPNCQRTAGF